MNVKTIAQFNLLGDPSITPISIGAATPKAITKISATDTRTKRAERRRDLFAAGMALAKAQPSIRKIVGPQPQSVVTRLRKLAKSHDVSPGPILSFEVTAPIPSKQMPKGLAAKEIVPDRIHVIFRKNAAAATRKGAKLVAKGYPARVIDIVALVVEEVAGKVVSVEKAYSR